MTRLSIFKTAERQTWMLQEGRRGIASLRLARGPGLHGELSTEHGIWPIARDRRDWWKIAVGDPDDPVLRFEREQAIAAGRPAPLPWALTGRFVNFRARLGEGDAALTVSARGWRDPDGDLQVTGEWEQRDLTALACFFAILSRRRRSIILLST
jgi:hypothetical protein